MLFWHLDERILDEDDGEKEEEVYSSRVTNTSTREYPRASNSYVTSHVESQISRASTEIVAN